MISNILKWFRRDAGPSEETIAPYLDLESVLKGSQSGVWLWDLQEKVMSSDLIKPLLETEPFGGSVSGPHEEMRTWLRLIHPDDREATLQFLMGFFSKQYLENQIEFRFRKKAEHYSWTLCRAILKLDKMGRPHRLFGFISDISEQRELRQVLEAQRMRKIEQERLSALGQMAGGVAHEMNNPLAIVSGRVEQLLDALDRDSLSAQELRKGLMSIQATTERMTKTVRSLLWFSRDSRDDDFQECKWKDVWVEVLGVCSEKFYNNGIRIDFDDSANEARVDCHHTQLGQVLINLLNNSFDEICGQEEAWVKIRVYDEGNEVVLDFEDSGEPIREDVIPRLMEPFFTTKEMGKGTGLGLSISKGIVERHGGILRLERASPHPCFQVRLPAILDPALRAE